MKTHAWLFWLLAGIGPVSQVDAAGADPDATAKALSMLLEHANEPIPAASSCQGSYGQRGVAKVKDLLAVELASLASGKNTIRGKCGAKICSVLITHSAGDDVSSATITFASGGKAFMHSIECVITP